ncbi:MAG TPA: DUF488 domain-containing protein [Myxococcota bacterium]|nr:DUF488 domain-containing protein [Myxococcota bacterium]
MELASVGHSNRSASELIALLREADIRCVADVRRFPVSRRFPQHTRRRLEAELAAAGVAYVFLGDALGGRREPAPASDPARNGAWREPSLRAFADALDSPETTAGLAELVALGSRAPTAFLCAERDWRQCHRQIIADALVAQGQRVVHLLHQPGEREVHALHAAARVLGGRLSYPTLV